MILELPNNFFFKYFERRKKQFDMHYVCQSEGGIILDIFQIIFRYAAVIVDVVVVADVVAVVVFRSVLRLRMSKICLLYRKGPVSLQMLYNLKPILFLNLELFCFKDNVNL
jgi:hypothetical protein